MLVVQTMKAILYVMINLQTGKVEPLLFEPVEDIAEKVLRKAFSPEFLSGPAATAYDVLVAEKYGLSSWHVVDVSGESTGLSSFPVYDSFSWKDGPRTPFIDVGLFAATFPTCDKVRPRGIVFILIRNLHPYVRSFLIGPVIGRNPVLQIVSLPDLIVGPAERRLSELRAQGYAMSKWHPIPWCNAKLVEERFNTSDSLAYPESTYIFMPVPGWPV